MARRQRTFKYTPGEKRRYFAQLQGYQMMPDEELLSIETVSLAVPVDNLISRPGVRENCDGCGEEIINEREVLMGEHILCQPYAGNAYYKPIEVTSQLAYHSLLDAEKVGV